MIAPSSPRSTLVTGVLQVNSRQYRVTVLAEMIDELRAPEARVRRDGGPNVAAYREARECLKQVAIETGEWQEEGPPNAASHR